MREGAARADWPRGSQRRRGPKKETERREGRKEGRRRSSGRGKGEYEAGNFSDLSLNSTNSTLCDSDMQKMFHFCNGLAFWEVKPAQEINLTAPLAS